MSNTPECLCIELRTAAQQLTSLYDRALEASGITITQFSLLHKIQVLETPTVKALAEVTGLDRSTLGRNLRVLVKQGLITMAPGDDARTRMIRVSRKGKGAFQRAVNPWLETQTTLTEQLGEQGREQLTSLLQMLTASADKQTAEEATV